MPHVDFQLKTGDTAPVIEAQLLDEDGNSIGDISGASITFSMQNLKDGNLKINDQSGTISDASNSKVQYTFTSSDTDTAGTFHGEFRVVYSDGSEETWPGGNDYIVIEIGDDLN